MVLITLNLHSKWSKYKIYHQLIFLLTIAILMQHVFNKSPWRPYWRIVAILKTSQHFTSIYNTKSESKWQHYQFYQIIFFENFVGFFKQTVIFPGSRWRPSWRLVAILELSEHSNSICIINFTFYMHKYISYSKNIILFTVCCHFMAQWHYMVGDCSYLGYWQPYWKDLNIGTVFITLFEYLLCLKHKIYYHDYLSQPSAALLRQKMGFQDSPRRLA